MNIGIDIQPLQTQSKKSGIGRYISNLIIHLKNIDKENEYLYFLTKNFSTPEDLVHITEEERLRYFSDWPFLRRYSWIWKGMKFPTTMRCNRIDVYHANSLAESVPIIMPPARTKACRIVVTVHDLIPLVFKESLPHYWPKGMLKYDFGRKLVDLEKADAIITVSESCKEDIRKHLSVDPDKVYVIYEAADMAFQKAADPVSVDEMRNRYGLPRDYILYVGGFYDPRKNLPMLIEAFHLLRAEFGEEKFKLVLAGLLNGGNHLRLVFRNIEERKLEEHVVMPGYVKDEDLPALYCGAAVLVYPSMYEGFGLPILEAMTCGTPVITSNVSSLPEISGDVALLVNPNSASSIAEGMYRVLSDDDLSEKLISCGLERAKLFTWEKTAAETIEVYKKVYKY